MHIGRATVFGGSGFLGRYIVQRLAHKGAVVRVAVRHPDDALFLKPMGAVGQIVPTAADVRNEATVAAAVRGADVVVNAVGAYLERGGVRFADVHVAGAGRVAKAAAEAGARRMVHISGIGADPRAPSAYASSRGAGEARVREAFPAAVILRPSVLFGPEDAFFNTLAAVARLSPVMPVFGDGRARMQPIYVGDVADAVLVAAERDGAEETLYELGGPRVYSYRELVELLLRTIERRRPIVPIPMPLARAMAFFMRVLPSPPLTGDQLYLMARDNLPAPQLPGLDALGIRPTAVEAILPTYTDRYRRGGRWKVSKLAL